MLWSRFPRCGLAGVPRGPRGREPWGQWVRGWCGARRTLPGLGEGGGSAAHKQVRAWSLPHHTQGSRPGPAAPAEAVKGAELPALHLGLPGAAKGGGKPEVPPLELGERRSALTPHITPWLPRSRRTALGAHPLSLPVPRRVAEKEPINKMSLHNLATVFGPTLLRPSEGESKGHLTLASDIWSHDVMAQVRAVLAVRGCSLCQHPWGGERRGFPACLGRFVTLCWMWLHRDKLGGGSSAPFWPNTPHLPATGPGPSLLPAASSHLLQ